MKKFLSILLAMMMCLSMVAVAVAEDAASEETGDEIPSVTAEVSFDATDVTIADTGYIVKVPTDWLAVAVTEEQAAQGLILNCAPADTAYSLQIVAQQDANQTADTMWETLSSTDGVEKLAEGYVNDIYFFTYDVPSTNSTAAMAVLDGGLFVTFVFIAPEGGDINALLQAAGTMPYEIIGSLQAQ